MKTIQIEKLLKEAKQKEMELRGYKYGGDVDDFSIENSEKQNEYFRIEKCICKLTELLNEVKEIESSKWWV